MPNTKMYQLKREWQDFQTLEEALANRVHEAYVLAQRQGAEAPKMTRLAPFLAEMFAEVSAAPVAVPEPHSDSRPASSRKR